VVIYIRPVFQKQSGHFLIAVVIYIRPVFQKQSGHFLIALAGCHHESGRAVFGSYVDIASLLEKTLGLLMVLFHDGFDDNPVFVHVI
jgi:hypothetical protein